MGPTGPQGPPGPPGQPAPSAWSLTGNSGTNPATNYIGTTDSVALNIDVGGKLAMQLLPTTNGPSVAIGQSHSVAGDAMASAVVGGLGNTIGAGNTFAATLGGQGNTVTANLTDATIVGGTLNTASGITSFIAGGSGNFTNGTASAVVGGNTNAATGNYSITLGGAINKASGNFSFAAGYGAVASSTGAFVWSDSSTSGASTVTSPGANTFTARAVGGFYFYTNDSGGGATLPAGSGTWTNLSDRNAKQAVEPVVPEQVLSKLESMPVTTWQYTTEVSGARHMGPMAQDFRAAYGLGDTDRGISTVDGTGVALAAIQGLAARLRTEQERNDRLEKELRELRALTERACGPKATHRR
jgi:hypothetical protein